MFQTLSLTDAFKVRHSCRSFLSAEFPSDKRQVITDILSEVNSAKLPFNTHGAEISETGPGLSRFWSTSKETGWLVQKLPILEKNKTQKDEEEERKLIIDSSYMMQLAVMKLTQHGIGTCWMAGTFNESLAESRFPGFKVKAVVAFGMESRSKHVMGRFFGMFGGHANRLPFEQILFDEDKAKVINEKEMESYSEPMKMIMQSLRSGPSPMNSQSWRFVIAEHGKEVHLFDSKNDSNSYFTSGIALANLKLLEEVHGGLCSFHVKSPPANVSPLGGKYVATAVYSE